MKPWEEIWINTVGWPRGIICDDRPMAVFGPDSGTTAHDYARAQLAAAAPDLVRALLAVEWEGEDGFKCPACMAIKKRGHDASCALDAALKRAGAR